MSPTTVEWVGIEEFPGYSVNTLGEVWNDSTRRKLQVRVNQYGVPYVGLMRNWRQCIRSLPRLVATAFIPVPGPLDTFGRPVFDTPINLNGDRTDCRAHNLLWRPRRYAILYANQFTDRYENPINAPIRDIETDDEWPDSLSTAIGNGLLEREVVLSILNLTYAWPTNQQFEVVE
jgi:hypothetical protein